MLGRGDYSNRLRQSMPYVGLQPEEEVKKSMRKLELDHVLRAAAEITGEKQFIIIGSQSNPDFR
jgi:hypothetical protein